MLSGLNAESPWAVNSGFVVGEHTTLIVDTGSNYFAAQTIFGYAHCAKPDNNIVVLNTGSKGNKMNNEDIKNLDLLSLFHYILGGITALFACIPFLHVFIGLAMISGKFFEEANGSAPPPFIGWLFVIMGLVFILLGWCLALFMVVTGKKLKSRKNRMFCMVVAGVECIFMPFGTVLGVLTLIVLNKDSIKEIFAEQNNTP
jgi:hypothetical protein